MSPPKHLGPKLPLFRDYPGVSLRNVFSRYGTHSIRFHQEEHEYFLKDYLTPDETKNLSNVNTEIYSEGKFIERAPDSNEFLNDHRERVKFKTIGNRVVLFGSDIRENTVRGKFS